MKEAMALGWGESVYFLCAGSPGRVGGWTVGGISSRSDVAGEDRKLVSVGEGGKVEEKKRLRKIAREGSVSGTVFRIMTRLRG
jgi:hypothetical protein